MPSVGFETFHPKRVSTVFEVQNVTKGTPQEKTVRLFTYPIHPGQTRDLLDIPFVSEADIRHSLLKGELLIKAECGEIRVVNCSIDLLQFDDEQRAFLSSIGVDDGCMTITLELGPDDLPFVFKQEVVLLGTKNNKNRVFTTPDNFINGSLGANEFRISIKHNGKRLIEDTDYTVSESMGVGTGFDTITFIAFAPKKKDTLIADYVVSAT